MWWFLAGCAGPEGGAGLLQPYEDSGTATPPRSLAGCTITRVIDDTPHPVDGVPDTVCTETWRRGDERQVIWRECEDTDGWAWGEEHFRDAFGCRTESRSWNVYGTVAAVTYTCDKHHQIASRTEGTRTETYANSYDALGRLRERTQVVRGEDTPYKHWIWRWGASGRLEAEWYSTYLEHDDTEYTYDVHGALVASDRRWVSGRQPDNILQVTYDALERPVQGFGGQGYLQYRLDWIYADDSVSAVHIRKSLLEDGTLNWQESRSWSCP